MQKEMEQKEKETEITQAKSASAAALMQKEIRLITNYQYELRI